MALVEGLKGRFILSIIKQIAIVSRVRGDLRMIEDDEDQGRRSGWVIFGYGITGLYAIGFFLAIWSPWAEFGSGIVTHRALALNEVGDLLAGAFAPLAFLWLLVAVMVQAQELRLQRKELFLTRREFAQARDVAQAQATEARKQAEFIGQQTEMLRASADQAKREQAAAEAGMVANLLHQRVTERMPGVSRNIFDKPTAEFGRVRQLREYLEKADKMGLRDLRAQFSNEMLQYFIAASQQLIELTPDTTRQVQIALQDSDPLLLQGLAQRLLTRLQNAPEPVGLGR